jgi:hypothetical protein
MTENLVPTPPENENKLIEHAPAIAIIIGNALLCLGEVRVYDYVFRYTGAEWKAALAVAGTLLPFIVWEILWQHKRATDFMVGLSLTGMVLSAGLGVVIGVSDFVLVSGAPVDGGKLVGAVAFSMSAHALMLLLYFYNHPDIANARAKARTQDEFELARQQAAQATALLEIARANLGARQELNRQYGAGNVDRMLAKIKGERMPADTTNNQVHSFASDEPDFTNPPSKK